MLSQIILICHNKSQELKHVIPMLAQNTILPDRVILSDDVSTDQSTVQFKNLCNYYSLPFRIARHKEDSTKFRLNTLRNSGVDFCDEGLIIILDADHVPAKTLVESHLRMHQNNPGRCLSTGPRLEYAYSNCTGPINFMWGHEAIGMLPSNNELDQISFPNWKTTLVSNIGIRKRSIVEIGGFDTDYDGNYGYDDLDFTWRAHQLGYKFVADWEAHVIHIPHPVDTHQRNSDINRDLFRIKQGFVPEYPDIIKRMGRQVWSDYYHEIKAKNVPISSILSNIPMKTADIEEFNGMLLLKAIWIKILKKINYIL